MEDIDCISQEVVIEEPKILGKTNALAIPQLKKYIKE
jgi:hypothetical protein